MRCCRPTAIGTRVVVPAGRKIPVHRPTTPHHPFRAVTEKSDDCERDDELCAAYLKAVADPLRLRVIRALQTGPLSVSDIAQLLEHEVATVSHHLRVLYHGGIVQTRRDGKYIYYSLNESILRSRRRKTDSVLDFGCCRLDVGDENRD